ncbi:MAG: F0F1 ATP synthase subunit B [Dehalococcoidia bacterium]|nr:F0F1 ATP synthase subunit B [Dehalococcoidia bacterium]
MGDMINSLGISWQGLLVQLINFSILFGALGALAYKPIMKLLDERSEKIKEGLDKSEQAEKRAVEIDVEAKKALEEARKVGQALIAQATETAGKHGEVLKEQAKKEAEALIVRARGEIQSEKDQAIAQLRKEFADITILAAGKVISEELDKTKHQKVIDEVLKASSLKGKE